MKEQMREAFRKFRQEEMHISTSTEEIFNAGYQAALSAVPANHVGDSNEMGQEPEKDIAESITLLSAIFDAWENGTDCYDDFDGVSGSFIGKAFNLDDKIFKRCCSLLNRINPPRNVSQQPAQEPVGEVQHYAAPANLPAYVNMKWYGKPPKNGTKLYTAPVKQEACDD